MTKHVLDVAQESAYLRVDRCCLVIERNGETVAKFPLGEVAALVVSHPQVTYTQAVLSGLVEYGGALVVCDRRHLPVGMLLPIEANYVQAERFALQANTTKPRCKRLWQQLVTAKVAAQGRLLARLHGDDHGLVALARTVQSGDATNVEAQASRRYWPSLFGDITFRRDTNRDDQNRLLNYGYAVLRAVVARAICAAGLHPSLGIHHHNRYNAFCMADDMMEPFRPMVDVRVCQIVTAQGPKAPLDPATKQTLLSICTARLTLEGESRTLFNTLARTASSLVAALQDGSQKLALPEI